MKELHVSPTSIGGLLHIDLQIHADPRGSFCEVFQAAKLTALGLPEFHPVQSNIVQNTVPGALRGFHAEPWDKYICVLTGRVFAAIADLRPTSPTFKHVCTFALEADQALYVPRGLGNAHQVLSAPAIYSYLVNKHWQPGVVQPGVAWNDPELNALWPLPVDVNLLSERDRQLPFLRDAQLS